MIEHGIVIGGRVLPDTERVIRDSDAWWTEGRETRPRAGARVDMLIGHWTAGHHREGPGVGLRLFRAMEARRSADGSRDLSVSVTFGHGADGTIWQFMDVLTAGVHVGARPIIRRSVSSELMWCGTAKQARRLGIDAPTMWREIDGRRVEIVAPPDALIDSWRWLADRLTSPEAAALGVHIPRRTLGLRRTLPWLAACGGGVGEHATLPRGERVKIDACGLLMEATGYQSM
jgi:hypothetical protein